MDEKDNEIVDEVADPIDIKKHNEMVDKMLENQAKAMLDPVS